MTRSEPPSPRARQLLVMAMHDGAASAAGIAISAKPPSVRASMTALTDERRAVSP